MIADPDFDALHDLYHQIAGRGPHRHEAPEEAARHLRKAGPSPDQNWTAFASKRPDLAEWIEKAAPTFEFAAAMREAARHHGKLTVNQIAAVEKCRSRDLASVGDEPADPAVHVEKMVVAFDTARANGIRTPAMFVGKLKFKAAPETGKNPGAIYVTENDVYLGKIIGGVLRAGPVAKPEDIANILAVCGDPLESAVAHGRKTGQCALCNRELTVGESIDRGIGPICAERYGF